MEKAIKSSYKGTCAVCKQQYPAGTLTVYLKGYGDVHEKCYKAPYVSQKYRRSFLDAAEESAWETEHAECWHDVFTPLSEKEKSIHTPFSYYCPDCYLLS